jgi:hypothetical protein
LDQQWGLGETRVFRFDAKPPSRNVARGEFQVFVPQGVERRAFALVASEELVIGRDVKILERDSRNAGQHFALVASAGQTTIGERSQLGSLYSLGARAPVLESSAVIHGFLKSQAAMSPPQRGQVTLGALAFVPSCIEQFTWDVRFPGGELPDRVSTLSAPAEVVPGAYDSIRVEPESTLLLRSGNYSANSFELMEKGTLEIDNLAGPVLIWVRAKLSLDGDMLDRYLEPNVLFGYAGNSTLVLIAGVRATLVAPEAEVKLQASAEPHSGAVFARSIVVADGVTVEHRGFTGRQNPAHPASFVCRRCALAARAAAAECVTEIDRRTSIVRASASYCEASCAAGRPECVEQCSGMLAEDAAAARRRFDGCAQRTSRTYDGCALAHGYRPDTCLALGFPMPRADR